MFKHDVDGVREIEFISELNIALHLFFDGSHQVFTALEIITAHQCQFIFHQLRLFDQARYPPIFVDLGNAEAARILNLFDPCHAIALFAIQKRKIRFEKRIREAYGHRAGEVLPRQIQGVGLSFHFTLHNIMRLEIGIKFGDETWNLRLAQIWPNNENIFRSTWIRNGFEHVHKIIERSSAGQAHERFGLAPCMRAHTRPPACHGNDDF